MWLKTVIQRTRFNYQWYFEVANRIMRIKRRNSIVTKVKRSNDSGEDEIFEDRPHFERVISEISTIDETCVLHIYLISWSETELTLTITCRLADLLAIPSSFKRPEITSFYFEFLCCFSGELINSIIFTYIECRKVFAWHYFNRSRIFPSVNCQIVFQTCVSKLWNILAKVNFRIISQRSSLYMQTFNIVILGFKYLLICDIEKDSILSLKRIYSAIDKL